MAVSGMLERKAAINTLVQNDNGARKSFTQEAQIAGS
jgi:hypothetical protein